MQMQVYKTIIPFYVFYKSFCFLKSKDKRKRNVLRVIKQLLRESIVYVIKWDKSTYRLADRLKVCTPLFAQHTNPHSLSLSLAVAVYLRFIYFTIVAFSYNIKLFILFYVMLGYLCRLRPTRWRSLNRNAW